MSAYCSVNATFNACGNDAAVAVANALHSLLTPIRNHLLCDRTPYNEPLTAPGMIKNPFLSIDNYDKTQFMLIAKNNSMTLKNNGQYCYKMDIYISLER